MPYTLMMFLLWGVAFFAIGLAVGWALRTVSARGDARSARASGPPGAGSAAPATPADEPTDDVVDEPWPGRLADETFGGPVSGDQVIGSDDPTPPR